MPYEEEVVARAGDLKDGEMKQVAVGETDVLLARIDGTYHALHAYCTHYGAPLVEGALSGERLVCPWHHACFDLTSGQHLEPPGLDGLPHYEVRREGDQVLVRVPKPAPERKTPSMASRDTEDDRLFVVLGGGAAGAYAVEALREAGYEGELLFVTREPDLPYDRVNCSKEYLQGKAQEAWMPLRSKDFYEEHDLDVQTGEDVTRVDADRKRITFAEGRTLNYDALLVCTGGRPRWLNVLGVELDNVRTLRSLRDSRQLREAGEAAEQVVIVGSSFIGMEGAWSLNELGCEVTVVAPDSLPFASLWGDRVGRMIQRLHEENGVRFRLGHTVDRMEGAGSVERVVLDDGETLAADLVLVGIGVDPATEFLEGGDQAEDGGLIVDEHLQAADGLYAAGDVAHFPYDGAHVRIEHWRVACQHGRLAGYNMAGEKKPYRSVPFFWSAQHGLGFYYVGHVKEHDRIVYDGDVEDHTFIAYYVKDGAVKAALGVNRNREMAALQELLRRRKVPDPDTLEGGDVDLVEILQQAK